ncbi:hypothetical protein Tco_0925864 [Tanacetum coccineum]|uniref:Reverse transcriptase domain-containing protein n=1 Tax=Tanacetum coccineum TaxID=301880 RepID=A0ABQ5D815_9ASTR
MSPPRRHRYCWNIAFATGCRRVGRRKWTNRRIRVPAFMCACRIEEELTWANTFGKEVEEYMTKVIAKDDLMENEQVYAKTGFAPHRIPQSEGNHNGWLSEEEEADSDSESTARVSTCMEGGIYNYGGQHNYTCATTQVDLQKMPPRRATGEDENPPNIATLLAQQLENLLPEIVNPVTASVNANANNGNGNGANSGNGGNVVLTRWIKRMEIVIDNSGCAENQKVLLVEEFCPGNEMERLENEFWNHKMIGANHAGYTDRFHELAKLVPHLVTTESARIKSAILKAGILTDEAVSNGTLTKGSEKRKSVDEPAKVGGSGRDIMKAKRGTNFVVVAPSREGHDYFARDCRSPAIPATPVNAVDTRLNQRACYECSDPNHLRNVCPKLNRESGQSRNQLALGWRCNERGGGNKVRGRAYNGSMNAVEAAKDSSVVTDTFS